MRDETATGGSTEGSLVHHSNQRGEALQIRKIYWFVNEPILAEIVA